MEAGQPISLCAKWTPTENGSVDSEYGFYKLLALKMKLKPSQLRKQYITPLRSYLNIVETLMCSNQWSSIDYSKVPSQAMRRLKKAFENNSPYLFQQWKLELEHGKTEVKAKQLHPHELVKEVRTTGSADVVCESQWKVLEEAVKELGSLEDALCVVDTSSSMFDPNYVPLDVSISLGLIISNAVKGPLKNHVITFNTTPEFIKLPEGSLQHRYNAIKNIPWGGSTNLQATFEMILDKAKSHKLTQQDMPKKLFIISDMQFNMAFHRSGKQGTNLNVIRTKYRKAKYEMPRIIFWNVNGESADFPVDITDDGTTLISGFSPSIMKAIINKGEISPLSIYNYSINDTRYKQLKQILE